MNNVFKDKTATSTDAD